MSFAYFPHTDEDIRQMLERIGVKSLEDLYADVPAEIRYTREFDLPDSLSEIELRRKFEELDRKNNRLTVFCGCGAYDHYAPAVIPSLIARSEYLTAYTPYQAEISQGTLRYIFEYQSMITELTGMDCTNASMYDGPTAAAEAMLMAMAATKKKKRVLLADTLLPQVREVVKTYAKYHGVEIGRIAQKDGNTDLESLRQELESGDVAGALVPSINRFGIIEDLSGMADALHAAKALLMVYADPSALAIIKTPGEWGADIACGDAQTLGLPLLFGGPYVGYLACRKELVRKLPGRIVGATHDVDGKRAFVLTLQAREQHIRREKASSNVCSNQAWCALTASVYMTAMGADGMAKAAGQCMSKAHYLRDVLKEAGLEPKHNCEFFHEFVTVSPEGGCTDSAHILRALESKGILGGLPLSDREILWCATEMNTREEMDELASAVREALHRECGQKEVCGS